MLCLLYLGQSRNLYLIKKIIRSIQLHPNKKTRIQHESYEGRFFFQAFIWQMKQIRNSALTICNKIGISLENHSLDLTESILFISASRNVTVVRVASFFFPDLKCMIFLTR